MIDRTEPVSSIKKTDEKIEYTLFKINQLTEQICLLLIDNESEKQKAQELCTEHMSRGSKALNESHVYTQNQLEKLHFTYEKLNLNYLFPPMNEPYLHNLAQPVRSVSSKGSRSSKSSSGCSNASRKELVKAELLADQEKLKAERKLEKSKLQEKQFRLHQELEKAEILENFEEAENKLKLVKILDDLEKKLAVVVLTSIKLIVDKNLIAITNKTCSIKIHLHYYATHKKQFLTIPAKSKSMPFITTKRWRN